MNARVADAKLTPIVVAPALDSPVVENRAVVGVPGGERYGGVASEIHLRQVFDDLSRRIAHRFESGHSQLTPLAEAPAPDQTVVQQRAGGEAAESDGPKAPSRPERGRARHPSTA